MTTDTTPQSTNLIALCVYNVLSLISIIESYYLYL